jgi:hypothetical protein
MHDEIWYNKFHGKWTWIISTETSENVSHYTLDELFDYWLKTRKSNN